MAAPTLRAQPARRQYPGRSSRMHARPNACGLTQLVTTLQGEGEQHLSAQEREESLESYYVNLLGGGGHG